MWKGIKVQLELLDLGVLSFIYRLVEDKCNATVCEDLYYCMWLIGDNYKWLENNTDVK